MLGVFALLHNLQVTTVFFGCRLDLIHAFPAIPFKKDRVRVSGQKLFKGAKLLIGTFKVL